LLLAHEGSTVQERANEPSIVTEIFHVVEFLFAEGYGSNSLKIVLTTFSVDLKYEFHPNPITVFGDEICEQSRSRNL
jgi:hypothetical protein